MTGFKDSLSCLQYILPSSTISLEGKKKLNILVLTEMLFSIQCMIVMTSFTCESFRSVKGESGNVVISLRGSRIAAIKISFATCFTHASIS